MWSDVSTRHLLALRTVAREGTFGRAAAVLGFTQSAVSQQVAALEHIVGHPLFDRPGGPRPPRLTPAGELLLGCADDVVERLEAAERELARHARGVIGSLTIGTFQSISARLLPMVLGLLHTEAPDVEVHLVEDDEDNNLRAAALERGDIDLAFTVGDVPAGLASVALGDDPHIALVPLDHPPGPVDLLAHSGHSFVGQPSDDACGRFLDDQFVRLGITPRYAFRSNDNGAVQGMVAAGVGIAIVPLLTVDAADPNVSVRATAPELAPRRLSIAWNPGRTLAPISNRFVELATDVCRDRLVQPVGAG